MAPSTTSNAGGGFIPSSMTSSNKPGSAIATIFNSDTANLNAWELLVGFRHHEFLISALPIILVDSSPFPFSTPNDSATSFSDFPNPDLKYPIKVADNLFKISVQISITGTFFDPLPSPSSSPSPSLTLPSRSLLLVVLSNASTSIATYYLPNPDFKPNTTTTSKEISF